jgi:hypothetical protein
MSAEVIAFPKPPTAQEAIDMVMDRFDRDADELRTLLATRKERTARYARLHRDCEARRRRNALRLVPRL